MGPMMTQFWGWCSILFFGLCAVAGVKLWWANAERLRINRSGIWWNDLAIPWDEITNVTEWRYKGTKVIVLHLRDPARFLSKGLARLGGHASRKLSGGDIGITLTGTDRKFHEATSAIALFRPNQ